MSTEDRRAQGATRIPFEALVEVGGALGPSFEAQAINLSEEGMHLRTAYLPEIGQPLSCRFDVAPDAQVIASGEVVWKQEQGRGGEFGIRFTNLDPQSAHALQRILGVEGAPPPPQGGRVRLHIEGLGSPMRARVKDVHGAQVTAFSELGFLQVGKPLELEDASTGAKRPARIDRVEVQIDKASHVPQLVVRLRYDDEQARVDDARASQKEITPEPTVIHDEPEDAHASASAQAGAEDHDGADEDLASDDSLQNASDRMRGAIARGAAKVTPALLSAMKRAKTTVALLAARRGGGSGEDVAIPLRRRTSPPLGGGLHASGRKVVRGDSLPDARSVVAAEKKPLLTPKRMIVAGAAGASVVLLAIALHKPAASANAADGAEGATTATGTPSTTTTAEAPTAPPASVLAPVSPTGSAQPGSAAPPESAPAMPQSTDTLAADGEATDDGTSERRPHRKIHVAPFSNGPVSHGNVLRLKMDGPIEKIEGASQATGFTVALPGRRSLEAAAPLAARDGRIASIRVTNDGGGAELTVAFKDGVPNYLVRAHGDVLEIVLAAPGGLGAQPRADRNERAPAKLEPLPAHRHKHNRR